MKSIRRTLLATLLVAVTAVTAAATAVVYRVTRGELDAVFDYHLRQIALSLRDQALGLRPGAIAAPAPDLQLLIQIWDADGERVYASGADAGVPEIDSIGFATVRTNGGAWRVFSAELAGHVIEIAQPLVVRQRLAIAAALRTVAPVALALPLLALLVWWIVGRALAPLDHLAAVVGSRSPALLEPVVEEDAPEEALPLVRALNALLNRLAGTLSAQRAFVADAAHELRTPLAALQLQLDLLETAHDERERVAALSDLRNGLQRAARVVQQLLTLAREEPQTARPPTAESVSLAELASEVVADYALMAEARSIDLGAARRDANAVVRGEHLALRTLLSNLVDNAVRYTPKGGRIDVTAASVARRPVLEVADTGPGIPAADRRRVFDRFYRRGGTSDTGAGLGLAIVKAVADRHGAAVSLADTPGGGLTVRVEFPDGADARPKEDGCP